MRPAIEAKMSNIPLDTVIGEYLGDQRLRNLSPRTIELYGYTLRKFAAYVQQVQGKGVLITVAAANLATGKDYVQAQMTRESVFEQHAFRPAETRRLSPHTIHQQIRILRSFSHWMEQNGYPNDLAGLKLPKLPKTLIEILTDEEIQTLLTLYNPNTYHGARWQALCAFFLDTGVRLAELATLRLDDLDLPNFRAKVLGKGSKERFVIFGARTSRCLSRYLHLFRGQPASDRVFVSLEGQPLTLDGIENIVKRARQKAHIPRLHCHLFRHTFATKFLMAGNDSFELQVLLGHESLEMTRRYTHLAQQLNRSQGSPLVRRKPSPLDVMEKNGIRFDSPRGRGVPRRTTTGPLDRRPD